MTQDEVHMQRAIRLAQRGRGRTSPNPQVGAVVVRDNRVVGEGYHAGPGSPHAEVVALAAAGSRAAGATLYTTLEPCCHTDKRTPPCTEALIRSGIRRVVSAMRDPNPQVVGKGIRTLRRAGIEVDEGARHAQAVRLNRPYVKWITTGQPYVTLKAAMTLDGRIATRTGESQWITSEASRRDARRLRAESDAILTGVGTILADNPHLTVRRPGLRNPLRVILDPSLRTPLKAHVVAPCADAATLFIATDQAAEGKIKRLRARGAEVEILSASKGRIAFAEILNVLGRRNLASVLIEGGGVVNGLALRSGCVDRVVFYMAPLLLCGEDAHGVFAGQAVVDLAHATSLSDVTIKKIGLDLRVEGLIAQPDHPTLGAEGCLP